jgi:hypothetical protein
MAELDAARAARDGAAAQVAELEARLETLAATEAALEVAQSQRNAAEIASSEAEEARALAEAQVAELQAELSDAQAALDSARTDLASAEAALAEAEAQGALLQQVQAELGRAELALYAATTRASELEGELQQAMQVGSDSDALQARLQELEAALAQMQSERDRLAAEIATMSASTESNAGEIERLRARVAELTAENATLSAALARAEAALGSVGTGAGATGWTEGPVLWTPNGTMALLPRFSWDGARMALADSTGGIALFDRATGEYEAHLARGIPDQITRLGFSYRGTFLIATTPNGTPNRLYHIPTQREILRFEPTTVTTANRAISGDEEFFVYTRNAEYGRVNVVLLRLGALANASGADPASYERILTSVPQGTDIRVSFAETSNQITIVTPDLVQLFETDGRLARSAANRIGANAAISPLAGDQGLVVLRGNGDVEVFDHPIAQSMTARIEARATYSTFRLSGDRLHFLRANARTWEVIDLLTGQVRSGDMGDGYGRAEVSVSHDGSMLLLGAIDGHPARLLEVETGAQMQEFGAAAEGYFSFDGQHLVTGTEGEERAQIWTFGPAAPR